MTVFDGLTATRVVTPWGLKYNFDSTQARYFPFGHARKSPMACRLPTTLVAALTLTAAGLHDTLAGEAISEPPVLKSISVPPGFTVELVAGPPLVERPMLASFDDQGRLYVCDSAGVNLRGPELSKNPPHVIRVLEDSDGDGRFDRSRVFADKMVFPQGIVWHDGAVFCSSPPSFWKLEDTDGDGVADRREELVTGFANTGVADDMHGGSLGPDGRLYWCAGRFPHEIRRPGQEVIHKGTAPLILRCRPDGSDLEVVAGSQGNAVGVAFLPEGDMFASGTFLAPNSMGAGLRDALVHVVDGAEYPVRDRTPAEHKRTGDMLPPLTHLGVSASSDLMACRGDALGADCRGNLFSALFNMHKVVRHKLERTGATFACRNEDFLVSSHADFHPTDVLEDADGSILVIDTGGWFRIGCPTSQLAKPDVMGGIYRVRRQGAASIDDPRGNRIAWTSLEAAELAKLLADPRFEVRDRASRQLARLGTAGVDALGRVLASDAEAETKCAAVWALTTVDQSADQMAARRAVRAALDDSQAAVRQAAARSAGLHRDGESASKLMALVTSDQPEVRREAATALGRIGQANAVPALLEALNAAASDRFLEHALIFALIRIGDRPSTLLGLAMSDTQAKRGALIALDQMDDGRLTPQMVLPLLAPSDTVLRKTALWVIAHHADWGEAMRDVFASWLARGTLDDAERGELAAQLVAFAGNEHVQELIAQQLANPKAPRQARLMLLEVMAQAPIVSLSESWVEALQQALADESDQIVGQAVATLRGLPLDKRPLVSRVDAEINFPMTDKRFGGTRLSENFCVRWTGIVRCPSDGDYTFYTNSDDGSQLFVDGKLVVDNGGSHAMREKQGRARLSAGDHSLRLDFVQGEGEAGCILSWSFDGVAKQVVPAAALFHQARSRGPGSPATLQAGLTAEFFELGGGVETFPDLRAGQFAAALARVALDAARSPDVRVQAAAVATPRLASVEPVLFDFLMASLDENAPALVRLNASEALGQAHLDASQLLPLAQAVARAGVLEAPRLVLAFEQTTDAEIGRALVASLGRSAGLRGIEHDALAALIEPYPPVVRQQAQSLLEQLSVNRDKQKARLAELEGVLAGGDIQRGRDLFVGNKKAICATCHSVQGQGGKTGPDLSKIGAIRAPADLLEAIVFPSASFARGYESYSVATTSGQVLSGIISRETADAIYLFDTARVETRVPRTQIESLEQSRTSIMPEGMDAQLSRQELSDLLAFLQSLR
jgi:putative membrane-bound dehydrogenase-like protein